MKFHLSCTGLLMAGWWLPTQLAAYTVEPAMLVLGAGGRDSSAFVRLVNKEARPAAIELVVNEFRRDLDGRGVTGKEADSEFIVYPAQVLLLPGDEVNVQVRWIGSAPVNSERTFSLTTREVAMPRKEPESQAREGVRIDINVLMNYDVRVYVAPRGARSKMTVDAVIVQPHSGSDPDMLEVTLGNRGTAHHSLRDMALVLTALDESGNPLRLPSVKLAAQDLPGMSASLLANSQRRIVIPWPASLPEGPVRAVLSE